MIRETYCIYFFCVAMTQNGKAFFNPQQASLNKRLADTPIENTANRRFFRGSLTLLSILLLIWIWQKLNSHQILPLRCVRVMGDFSQHSQNRLHQTIVPFVTRKGLLAVDRKGLQARLLQASWIASVDIGRIWPDTLAIEIKTRAPMARVHLRSTGKEVSQPALLDNQGHIFYPETDLPIDTKLPLLVGSLCQMKHLFQLYLEIEALLSPLGISFHQLSIDDGQRCQLELTHGTQLILGHLDPVRQLRHLLAVCPQYLRTNTSLVASVDLRYPHGMAVLMQGAQ